MTQEIWTNDWKNIHAKNNNKNLWKNLLNLIESATQFLGILFSSILKKEKLSFKRNNPTILFCSTFTSNIIHKLQNIYGQEYAPS